MDGYVGQSEGNAVNENNLLMLWCLTRSAASLVLAWMVAQAVSERVERAPATQGVIWFEIAFLFALIFMALFMFLRALRHDRAINR